MRSNWNDTGGSPQWTPFSLSSIPVVRGILIAEVLCFIVYFLTTHSGGSVLEPLFFQPSLWYLRPWSWLTYSLLTLSPVGLLFQGFWLYMIGGSLERSWGSRNFAVLYCAFTAISALAFVPAYYLLRQLGYDGDVALASLLLPNTALTVAWAAVDPEQVIRFYGVIPVAAKWVAVIDVFIVFCMFGLTPKSGLLLGPVSLAGSLAAFYYVRKMPRLNLGFRAPRATGRPRRRAPLLREDAGPDRERVTRVNPFAKKNEQQEIERLKRLLGEDDDDQRAPRR